MSNRKLKASMQERFDAKWVENENGCHIWVGSKFYHGYGRFRIDSYSTGVAHRVAWYLRHKVWPDRDLFIIQECGEVACVNPDHLIAVKRDSRDFEAIAERLAQKPKKRGYGQRKDPTLCKAGKHAWIPENIRIINRSPSCIQCNREQSQAWRERKKAMNGKKL